MARICRYCGGVVEVEDRFCDTCGRALPLGRGGARPLLGPRLGLAALAGVGAIAALWLFWSSGAGESTPLVVPTYATLGAAIDALPLPEPRTSALLRSAQHARRAAERWHGGVRAVEGFCPAFWVESGGAARCALWTFVFEGSAGVLAVSAHADGVVEAAELGADGARWHDRPPLGDLGVDSTAPGVIVRALQAGSGTRSVLVEGRWVGREVEGQERVDYQLRIVDAVTGEAIAASVLMPEFEPPLGAPLTVPSEPVPVGAPIDRDGRRVDVLMARIARQAEVGFVKEHPYGEMGIHLAGDGDGARPGAAGILWIDRTPGGVRRVFYREGEVGWTYGRRRPARPGGDGSGAS